MNYKQIQTEFEKLGYELTHGMGTEGRGYYLRRYGDSDKFFVTDYLEALEEKLFLGKKEAICA